MKTRQVDMLIALRNRLEDRLATIPNYSEITRMELQDVIRRIDDILASPLQATSEA